jgi:hypothetical protein
MAFYFLRSFLALKFQSGLVTRLNHEKNPKKQKKKVFTAELAVNMLFTTAKAVNIKKERPPKHAVMRSVNLKVISVAGVGFKKENGHQIKSLSESQL